MKKAEFVRYIADDGKMFCREDECLEYEKNHNASAEFMLIEIPHKIVIDDELTHLSSSFCYGSLFLYLRNETDVDKFCKWFIANRRCDRNSLSVNVGDTVVADVYFRNDYPCGADYSLKDIENVNDFKSVEQLIHDLIEQTIIAEHYVKYDFEKENTK